MSFFNGTDVKELEPLNFSDDAIELKKFKGLSIVLFYKPTCPYCKPLKPVWEHLQKVVVFGNVLAFNATESDSHMRFVMRLKEISPQLLSTFPGIIIYKNGVPVEVYQSQDRSVQALLTACMRHVTVTK